MKVIRDFTDLDRPVCLRCVETGDVIGGTYQRGTWLITSGSVNCTRCDQVVAYSPISEPTCYYCETCNIVRPESDVCALDGSKMVPLALPGGPKYLQTA